MEIISLITKKQKIYNVLDRWKEQYKHYSINDKSDKAYIESNLIELFSAGEQTEESISKIIGNRTWTELNCNNCEKDCQELLIFENYSHFIQICKDCLRRWL